MTNVVVVSSSYRFNNSLLPENVSLLSRERNRKLQKNAAKWSCAPRMQSLMVKAIGTPLTVSSRICTDIPFDEAPEASFDEYLEDKERVFEAIFPEKQASERLTEDEWRIHMEPIKTIFWTIKPVVEMRLKCNSSVSECPYDTSKVLVLEIIKSEIKGLDESLKKSEVSLGIRGTMYCERRNRQSRLKGETQLSMSFVLHPMMALIAEHVSRDAAQLVLRNLTENMKQSVNASLLADYADFKRERLKNLKLQHPIDSDSHHQIIQ